MGGSLADPVAKGNRCKEAWDGGCVCLSSRCPPPLGVTVSPPLPSGSRRGASSTASRRCAWATASRPSTTTPSWAAGTTRWPACCGSCPALSPSPCAWCSPKRPLVSGEGGLLCLGTPGKGRPDPSCNAHGPCAHPVVPWVVAPRAGCRAPAASLRIHPTVGHPCVPFKHPTPLQPPPRAAGTPVTTLY